MMRCSLYLDACAWPQCVLSCPGRDTITRATPAGEPTVAKWDPADYLKELRAIDDTALCKRLRGEYETAKYKPGPLCLEAAKRIESLSALAYQRWEIANARIRRLEDLDFLTTKIK